MYPLLDKEKMCPWNRDREATALASRKWIYEGPEKGIHGTTHPVILRIKYQINQANTCREIFKDV